MLSLVSLYLHAEQFKTKKPITCPYLFLIKGLAAPLTPPPCLDNVQNLVGFFFDGSPMSYWLLSQCEGAPKKKKGSSGWFGSSKKKNNDVSSYGSHKKSKKMKNLKKAAIVGAGVYAGYQIGKATSRFVISTFHYFKIPVCSVQLSNGKLSKGTKS